MWTYYQSTGVLDRDDVTIGVGYSGAEGSGKNNPAMESVPCVGPIPRGTYSIGEPFDSATHGPFAMSLIPDPANEMFGRSGFLLHGDSINAPGTASEGCVIMSRDTRTKVHASGDKRLMVIE